MSKDSLIKGTFILAMAAFVARILGVVQRVPLQYLLGDGGMGTYTIAFNIYMLLLTVATAGIPSALSKLVSERMELGRYGEANRIFRAAVQFSLAAGVVMTFFLFLYAPVQAHISGNSEAALAIRALAPALLLFPFIAIVRGYFQGRQRMMPNGLSQIVEQVFRLVTALALAYLFIAAGWGLEWAAAGASFGGVMGSVGAVAVLIYYLLGLRRDDRREGVARVGVAAEGGGVPLPYAKIYATIFKISVPIVLFSIAVPVINTIDSTAVIPLLEGQIGKVQANEILGQLGGRAQSLAGIPIILAIAISQSIVPIVAAAYAKKDMTEVGRQAGKALLLSILTGLPLVLLIAIAARPVNGLLFSDVNGTGIIAILTVTSLFQIVMQTSGAILMGMGEMSPLIRHVAIGIAVKLAASFALAPLLGIYGIVSATALCFIVMMVLNLRVLRKKVSYQILAAKRWTGLAVTVAVICAVGIPLEALTYSWIRWFPFDKINFFIQAVLVGGLVMALYPLLLGLTRVVTKADIATYPAALQKLVRRVGRFAPLRLRG